MNVAQNQYAAFGLNGSTQISPAVTGFPLASVTPESTFFPMMKQSPTWPFAMAQHALIPFAGICSASRRPALHRVPIFDVHYISSVRNLRLPTMSSRVRGSFFPAPVYSLQFAFSNVRIFVMSVM